MSRDRAGKEWRASFNGVAEVGRVRKSTNLGARYAYWVEFVSTEENTPKHDKWVHFVDVLVDGVVRHRKWTEFSDVPWEIRADMRRMRP